MSPPPAAQPRDVHPAAAPNNAKQNAATLGDATSQFAAGFAAATALSNSQVRSAVNEALANHAQAAAANRQQGAGLGEGGGGGIDGNGGVGQRRDEGGGGSREQRYMYSPGNFYK